MDLVDVLETIRRAVSHLATTTAIWPKATVGPPQYLDNSVARYCEVEYAHPKERFIQRDAKLWWIRQRRG